MFAYSQVCTNAGRIAVDASSQLVRTLGSNAFLTRGRRHDPFFCPYGIELRFPMKQVMYAHACACVRVDQVTCLGLELVTDLVLHACTHRNQRYCISYVVGHQRSDGQVHHKYLYGIV